MLQKTDCTPSFHVVGGQVIAEILGKAGGDCIEVVKQTYLDHGKGNTHNPDSYFLRFDDAPQNRIIALPATLKKEDGLSGIKWISSFPGNLSRGMQRASAVLVLNDPMSGYPFALLEASRISSARTAASAVLGAFYLNGETRRTPSMSFVGGGIIGRSILDTFVADNWEIDKLRLCDLDDATVRAFSDRAQTRHGLDIGRVDLDGALEADIVVLATTVPAPYIKDRDLRPGQIVLNISLRDVSPEIIAASNNILDDVEHCLKADTSPDLAVRKFGHRDFINGTIAELMTGEIQIDPGKPTIYSPFGLGVLDLAVGRWVFDEACRQGKAQQIDNFLFEMER